MKSKIVFLAAALLLGITRALAHGGVELGPHGGRILEFSKNETMHGEVTAKDGFFHIALLDKDMKPVELRDQTLTAITGNRQKPEKLTVEKRDGKFVVPMQSGDSFLTVFQFREAPGAKPITARLEYDAAICSACKQAEWLCQCSQAQAKDHPPADAKPKP